MVPFKIPFSHIIMKIFSPLRHSKASPNQIFMAAGSMFKALMSAGCLETYTTTRVDRQVHEAFWE